MRRFILYFSVLLGFNATINAQKVVINTDVKHPDNPKYVVTKDDVVHALEGADAMYSFTVDGLDSVENVVSCQYVYNGAAPADASYILNKGELTINNLSFNNLATNVVPNTLSMTLVVKEKGKESNTTLPVAEAKGVRIYTKPTCEVSKEPVRFVYQEKMGEAKEWELIGAGGGKWEYTWTTSAGQKGTLNTFSIDEIKTIGGTTISVVAKNIAPDNTTEWSEFKKEWTIMVYGKAGIQELPTNTEATALHLFQKQNWPLKVVPNAGFPSGWTYEWKDAEDGTVLGQDALYSFNNPISENIVNRHIILLVKNVAEIGQGQTEEWFNQSYHFYAKFYPQPVVAFDDKYVKNVLDGDAVKMGVTVKDTNGNSIMNDANYTWSYKWSDRNLSGNETTYNYVAENTNNNNGIQNKVTLVVSALLANGNGELCPLSTLSHTFTVWPKPANSVAVPVNTAETPIEHFQNQKCQLSTTPNGGYKSGWTYEWKDAESGDILSRNSSCAVGSQEADDIINKHIILTVVNTVGLDDNLTKEWYRTSYDYYINFYPLPVVAFENVYPTNVIDGDKVQMGFTIKDKKGNSIINNSNYVWLYEWKENSNAKSQQTGYDYIADNINNNDGVKCELTLSVSGRLNGVNATFSTERQHTYVVWPKPEVNDLSHSEEQKVECGGRMIDLLVTSAGGQKSGWTCQWLKDGVEIAGETGYEFVNELKRAATSDAITEKYSVHIKNVTENVVRKDTIITYTVLLYPEPWAPSDIVIVDKNRSMTPQNAIREGNVVSLLCDECYGGYPGAWTYEWTQNGKKVSDNNNTEATISVGYSGDMKDNSKTVELKCMVNNGYNSVPWRSELYSKTYTVYKKPQTPLSIVKKGNGTSGTVVATTKLSDVDLQNCDYYLVFGYIDTGGGMHDFASQLQTNPGEVRWSRQIPVDIVKSNTNTLYVYALWKYNSAEITSGLRTLSGVDESWDGSDYSGHTRSIIAQTTGIAEQSVDVFTTIHKDVYSMDGRKTVQMKKGINIVKSIDGSVKKVITK